MPAKKRSSTRKVPSKKAKKSASKRRSKRKPYHVHRLRTWLEYVETVSSERYRTWAYRGHADAAWNLSSTLPRFLERAGVHKDHWRYQERRSIKKFQERAHHFLRHVPEPDDTFQWLALMQHHGAPTRLLDFTWSPYVAAFFALDTSTKDAAVWAIDAGRITYNDLFEHGEAREKFDARIPGVLDARYIEEESDRLFVGEPERKNERIIAQSGTFAIPGSVLQPIDELLAARPRPRERITKFILPKRIRRDAIEELQRMNILNATLFPGLDGLARSISHDLEFHWSWDVTKRSRWRP